MNDHPDLFSPITLGAINLPNRIVMAPMTRNRAGDGNAPVPMNAEYYVQRASAGLIITEAAPISVRAHGYPFTPGIYTEPQIAGWRMVTDAVHAAGGRIYLQLWHVGRISHSSFQPNGELPVAPSAIRAAGDAFTMEGPKPFETPRALETDELPGIAEDYANATVNARSAGFDGVEIHSANGYLLDQFLRDGTNHRTDQYGGSKSNRYRLIDEIVSAVCDSWSADRVGIRLSPLNTFNDMRDSDPRGTFTYAVEQLNRFGLAYLHVTEAGMDGSGAAGPEFDFAELRRIWRGPYMTNLGYTKDRAQDAIRSGAADLVAFGIPYIANPDLVERFTQDAPLNEADPDTFYGGDEKGYTDYPSLDQGS